MKLHHIIFIAALPFAVFACHSEKEATEVLAANGYTNIETDGYAWLGCSEGDSFRTSFDATAPNGTKVEGVVCSGWLEGATIRLK